MRNKQAPGRRRRSREERIEERKASQLDEGDFCLGCRTWTEVTKEHWSGQFLRGLCDKCYEVAKDGSLDEYINWWCGGQSTVHTMKGGLPTLGKRR